MIAIKRIGAFLVDCVLLFMVLAPLGFGVQHVMGITPETGPETYLTLVLGFSLPAWLYFILGDCSQTVGKRLFRLRTVTTSGEHPNITRAAGRTAIKLAPWELAHLSVFIVSPVPGEFDAWGMVGIALVYALVFLYLGMLIRTGGARSIHDIILRTRIERVERPAIPQGSESGP